MPDDKQGKLNASGNIEGPFYMLQSEMAEPLDKDSFGHPRVRNPGRSIYFDYADIERAAKEMAVQYGKRGYYIMAPIAYVKAEVPVVVQMFNWKYKGEK